MCVCVIACACACVSAVCVFVCAPAQPSGQDITLLIISQFGHFGVVAVSLSKNLTQLYKWGPGVN